MKKKRSTEDIVVDTVNFVLLSLLMVICLYPIIYVMFASVSDSSLLMQQGGLLLWPRGFQLDTYAKVFENQEISTGYINTVFYVAAGTGINIIMTTMTAYVLSRRNLRFKSIMNFFVVFTMFVGGGLVPTYLLVKDLGMLNTVWAILLPGAIGTYNMLMTRAYFNTIPYNLEEAAMIDGTGPWGVFIHIMLPLSKPILAVIGLYYAVGHWNGWFSAMIYLNDRSKYPVQLILREILILNETSSMMDNETGTLNQQAIAENIKYATIVVATVPILCIYPFVQKYFVKGVMVGAVKG